MFIIIIGGMGSDRRQLLGAAFMILLPILLDHRRRSGSLGGAIDAGQLENFQKVLFGALIIWFLIKEPNGLAALLSRARQSAREASCAAEPDNTFPASRSTNGDVQCPCEELHCLSKP